MAGESKKPSLLKRKRVWSPEDVIQLSAWLDYSLREGIDFDTTIVNHLKIKVHKDFSLQQARRRLKLEWENLGHDDSKSSDDLYRQGTACLFHLTSEERDLIQQAVDNIGPSSVKYRLRGTSTTLRSQSQSVSIAHHPSEASTLSTVSTIGPAEFDSAASVHGDGHIERELSDYVSSTSTPLLLQVQPQGRVASQDSRFSDIKVESSTTDRSFEVDLPLSAAVDTDNQLQALQQELSKVRRTSHTSEARVGYLQNEVFNLNDQLWASRNEYKELRHRTRAAATSRGDTSLLTILQDENAALKKTLLLMQNSRQEIKELKTSGLGPSDTNIRKEYFLLYNDILDSCSSLSHNGLLVERFSATEDSGNGRPVISVWADRVSGLDLTRMLRQSSELAILRIDVLRSLVAAGLCSLIFELPLSQLASTESPLLQHYRKQLLSRDGVEALQQLDVLAYKSLMSDETFESCVIEEKAKSVSEYLCHALQDLIAPHIEIEILPAAFFEHAIQSALRLKFQLHLSGRSFLWVFAKPGDIFNFRIMDTKCNLPEGPGSARGNKYLKQHAADNSNNHKVVKLCIFPTLYSEKSSKHDASEYRPVVQTVFNSQERLEDPDSFQLICKAVVLL
ncbi:hypothetical protein BKA67DRAFT_580362 [Truncatella angustata]|uniref:Uncharacterized protein n=1 Tax=Truncatella angustata TaxID=152316 RepID=A0A9P8RNI0_9PEZI|nr:uncharacterized protein BKA67DRAFT_580362 [Truncatella angustata]KAH6646710.1 hypothetical protein BKA67DRAFT_580362 [Truncatella angustata]